MLHNVLLTVLDTVWCCPWNWFNVTSKFINCFECCHKSPHVKQNHAPIFGDEKYCADLWAFFLYLYLQCCSQRAGRLKSKAPKQVSLPTWGRDKQELEVWGNPALGKNVENSVVPNSSHQWQKITIQKSFYNPVAQFFPCQGWLSSSSKWCELLQMVEVTAVLLSSLC